MVNFGDLKANVAQANTPHERIDSLNQYAGEIWSYNLVEAIELCQQARELAYQTLPTAEPHWNGLAHSLVNLAFLACRDFHYDEVAPLLDDADTIFLHIHDMRGIIRSYFVRGMLYLSYQQYDNAFLVLQEGLDKTQLVTDIQAERAGILMLMGTVHLGVQDYDQSLTYYLHAQDIYQQIQHPLRLADSLSYICRVQAKLNAYDLALEAAHKALAICHEYQYLQGEVQTMNNMAEVYIQMGNLQEAGKRLYASIPLADSIQSTFEQCRAYTMLAKLKLGKNELDEARANFEAALNFAQRTQYKNYQADLHEQLSIVFERQKEFERALQHHRKFYQLRHELYSADTDKRIQNMVLPNLVHTLQAQVQEYDNQEKETPDSTEDLNQRVEDLKIVLQVHDEVSSNLNVNFVLSISLDAAMRLSGAQAGFVALRDGEKHFKIETVIGQYQQHGINTFELPETLQPALSNRKVIAYTEGKPPFLGFPYLSGSRAQIIIPLYSQESLMGIINLETTKTEFFRPDVMQVLELLKGFLAIALENARLYEKTQDQLAELKKAHAKVSYLEQVKTDMIQLAAHDLKNPLSVVKMYAQMLLAPRPAHKLLNPETQTEYIRAIETSAKQMVNLIDDILSLERIEQMAESTLFKPVDVVMLAQKAHDGLQMQAYTKSLSFRFECVLNEAIVMGDPVQLNEAMHNLINNGIKYTSPEGSVTVRLRLDGKWVLFAVEDTGYGIPKEMQDRIFQPFYRAKSDKTQNISGTGLGLHLVKNIVERHGGNVFFDSEYGVGSTFGFRVPATSLFI
jgi:signal transduction histidine kinase/tetratricopeptide (TPR) repeat protein